MASGRGPSENVHRTGVVGAENGTPSDRTLNLGRVVLRIGLEMTGLFQ